MAIKFKGSLLSSYALIWILIGLALATLLLGIASNSWLGINNSPDQLTGGSKAVAERLAKLAQTCWQQNQGSSESAICQVTEIKTEERISEANFTQFLDCNKLENGDFNCGRKDELDWEVDCKQCSIKVQYLPGRILIKSLD